MDPHERIAFHILGWLAAICFWLYAGVFLKGFVDGLGILND
jgi:hypothetical protein